MDNFRLPSWSARNPLGIVALFISLIYGMSALLLGTSVRALSPANQTILVVFIVSFPFVVLGVFAWLVARHHMKLYGPGDYRNDKSFLDTLGNLPPEEVTKKLQTEIAESAEITAESDDEVPQPQETPASTTATLSLSAGSGKSMGLTQAFLLEAMVFQALQREFRASIRRNISLPNGRVVDGIIESTDGSIIIVEVRFVNSTRNILNAFHRLQYQMQFIVPAFSQPESKNPPRVMLALVFDGKEEERPHIKRMIDKYRMQAKSDAEVRLYYPQQLYREYGITEEPTP